MITSKRKRMKTLKFDPKLKKYKVHYEANSPERIMCNINKTFSSE